MWSSFIETIDSYGTAATRDRLIVTSRSTGEIFAVDPTNAGSLVAIGRGWAGLGPVAVSADSKTLLVTDDRGTIWQTQMASADPRFAHPLVRGLLGIGQVVIDHTEECAYAVAGSSINQASDSIIAPIGPARRSIPVPGPVDWLSPRNSLVRISLVDGTVNTVSRNMLGATGVALAANGKTLFVTESNSGNLLAVEISTGTSRVIAGGLADPGFCCWFDEARTVLAVVEMTSRVITLIDVKDASRTRRVPNCPGVPRTPAVIGGVLAVAAGSTVASIPTSGIALANVLLVTPNQPIYRGGYTRIPVDLGLSGIPFEDLSFSIAEGAEFGDVSLSRDDTFDRGHPHTILLAGPHPGRFTLRATHHAGGPVVSSASFTVTDGIVGKDGQSRAWIGVEPAARAARDMAFDHQQACFLSSFLRPN